MTDCGKVSSIPVVFRNIFVALTAFGEKDPAGRTKTIKF
jgi:hypothetical protein